MLWHQTVEDFPKKSRYSLGGKIDNLFIEVLETIFVASYLSKKDKLPFVQKAINKLDLLKFFLQVSYEIKSLDDKRYIALSEPLTNIGKMLGGWKNRIIKENSPQ
ncbi:MAG: four helix bundle protein [Candidatus Vogelbacteria bacterium]|nr:four helix bundle protein [Candidatus Vogelbacteria bacterium]